MNVNEIATDIETTVKKAISDVKKKKIKTKSKKELEIEKDTKIVKGVFRYTEIPGGTMKFSFRKYKEVPLKSYSLVDGQIYELPYMVAKHISNNCSYPIHRYMQDDNGNVHTKVGQKVSRCRFEPLDFIDTSDYDSPNIITVERI